MLRKVATVSQKNSGTNPLPTLINVAGCQTCAVFDFFLFPCFHNIEGEGVFKVFALDMLKVALVVPLYILTDYLKIMGGCSNLKSPNFFFQTN